MLFWKSLWVSGYRTGFAHHRSWVQETVSTLLSTELPTVDHHDSMKLSVR